jgi:uncharacterized membrane protein
MNKLWIIFSVISGLAIGSATILNKILLNTRLDVLSIVLYKYIFALFFVIIITFLTLTQKEIMTVFSLTNKQLLLLIFSGFISCLIFIFSLKALEDTPNLGYSSSIISSFSIILVLFYSILFLQGEYNRFTFLGIILIILGSILVKFYS